MEVLTFISREDVGKSSVKDFYFDKVVPVRIKKYPSVAALFESLGFKNSIYIYFF